LKKKQFFFLPGLVNKLRRLVLPLKKKKKNLAIIVEETREHAQFRIEDKKNTQDLKRKVKKVKRQQLRISGFSD
jgi:hypothetical protein